MEQDQAHALLSLGSTGSRSYCFGWAELQHHPSHGLRGWEMRVEKPAADHGDCPVQGPGDPRSVVLAGIESFSPSNPTLLDLTYPQCSGVSSMSRSFPGS